MITQAAWLGTCERHLVDCQDGHRLSAEACVSFNTMQQHAQKDGIDIQLVSSFRSFERQLTIWNQKWLGSRTLYSIEGKPLDPNHLSDSEKLDAILTFSALPGASRHHWGSDCDVYDRSSVIRAQHKFELVNAEYQEGGPCYPLHCWLEKHADKFGFSRPYSGYNGGVAIEQWHLSFKTEAQKIETQFNLAQLRELLSQSDILGKDCILTNLERIYRQYILNGSPS